MSISKREADVMNVETRVSKLETAVTILTTDVSKVTQSVDKLTEAVKESHNALVNKVDNIQIDNLQSKKTDWGKVASVAAFVLAVLLFYIDARVEPLKTEARIKTEVLEKLVQKQEDKLDKFSEELVVHKTILNLMLQQAPLK